MQSVALHDCYSDDGNHPHHGCWNPHGFLSTICRPLTLTQPETPEGECSAHTSTEAHFDPDRMAKAKKRPVSARNTRLVVHVVVTVYQSYPMFDDILTRFIRGLFISIQRKRWENRPSPAKANPRI